MRADGAAEWGRPYQSFADRKVMYRKRRKRSTEEFVGGYTAELEELEKAKREDKGLYCKEDHKRRGWSQLHIGYDISNGHVTRVWFCDLCGNELGRKDIT